MAHWFAVGIIVTSPGPKGSTIADPVSDHVLEVRAEIDGVVIGMALPQVVLSGSPLFHVGELRQARDAPSHCGFACVVLPLPGGASTCVRRSLPLAP